MRSEAGSTSTTSLCSPFAIAVVAGSAVIMIGNSACSLISDKTVSNDTPEVGSESQVGAGVFSRIVEFVKGPAKRTRSASHVDQIPVPKAPGFHYQATSGPFSDHFVREGKVAVNLETKSGADPRIVAAFPAGNSAAGLWLDGARQNVSLRATNVGVFEAQDEMRGVRTLIESDARQLKISDAMLGSTRFLRNRIEGGEIPPEVIPSPARTSSGSVQWSRTSFDGVHHYSLELEPAQGTTLRQTDGHFILENTKGPVQLSLRAATDEPPLTPIPAKQLFRKAPNNTPSDAHDALEYLFYKEKLLAGSWRYHTYFGRDTLLTTTLAMDALTPEAIEGALGSVLERLDGAGRVAHEEDIGDFAAWRRLQENGKADVNDLQAPIYDYKMIDDDLLLPIVLTRYLREHPQRVKAFLARTDQAGTSYRTLVERNADYVLSQAEPYAQSGKTKDLIALKDNLSVGQWRDSNQGLGNGRYPYDVNAVLMPSALRDVAYLSESLLDKPKLAKRAKSLRTTWKDVHEHFRVSLSAEEANARASSYLKEVGLDQRRVVPREHGVEFAAIALDASGKPIPIMHSDEGFELAFGDPSPERASQIVERAMETFPFGLNSEAGMLIAVPTFAPPQLRKMFSSDHYHGTVSWSWHYALYDLGIQRQLALGGSNKTGALKRADQWLTSAMKKVEPWLDNELWTWTRAKDRARMEPQAYGVTASAHSESNLAQAWSAAVQLRRWQVAQPQ